MRERLLSICSKYCKLVGTEFEGIIKVFEAPNGTRYILTSKSGMAETVSLKSKVWDGFKFCDNSLSVVNDSSQHPVCFSFNRDGQNQVLKHSSVTKVILEEPLDDEDVLKEYPPMLPNSNRLDLSYALECELLPAPNYWI